MHPEAVTRASVLVSTIERAWTDGQFDFVPDDATALTVGAPFYAYRFVGANVPTVDIAIRDYKWCGVFGHACVTENATDLRYADASFALNENHTHLLLMGNRCFRI